MPWRSGSLFGSRLVLMVPTLLLGWRVFPPSIPEMQLRNMHYETPAGLESQVILMLTHQAWRQGVECRG